MLYTFLISNNTQGVWPVLKLRNAIIAFIIIFIQGSLALGAGLGATYLGTGDVIQQGVYVGNIDVGGMAPDEAAKKLEEHYSGVFSKDSLEITIEGIDNKIEIPYSEISASFDSKATLAPVIQANGLVRLRNIFKGYPVSANTSLKPVITFNEGKIRQVLMKISEKIDKEAQNAALSIIDGKVVKTAESSGLKLDVAKASEKIREQMEKDPEAAVSFNMYSNKEIAIIEPYIRLRDIEEIEQIIAEYTTDISDTSAEESIKTAAEAINGLIIPVYDEKGKNEEMEFSFINWLTTAKADISKDNAGYDQVASTLYAAILKTGIKTDAITRLPHQLPSDYIEPGLDAWITGNGGDLKFKNTLNKKIAIFAEVENSKLTIRIAGNLSDRKQESDTAIKVDVIKMLEPSVVNIENKELAPEKKVVVTPGKKGMVVEVYRGSELVGTDKYEAVNEIVQIGQGAEWRNTDSSAQQSVGK
jgi:vancomycin resistance protein YoaR